MERKREFDIARGFAVYLVVLGHLLEQGADRDIALITFCHMPVFFMISGYFMKLVTDGAGTLAVKKIKRLLIPYFVWSGVSFGANVALGLLRGQMSAGGAAKEFLDIFLYARSAWFLIMLFAAEMLGICAALLAKRIKISVYPVMGAMWLAMGLIQSDEIFKIYKLKWLFPFFVLGVFLKEFGLYEKANKKILAALGALFPVLALLTYRERLFREYITCSYTDAKAVFAALGYYVISVLSICLVIGTAYLIKNFRFEKPLETAGRYSMEVYVIHMFFLKAAPSLPGIRCAGGAVYLICAVYALIITAAVVILSKYVLGRFKLFRFCVGKE